jgi:biopolymer transport protein ExbD
MASVNAGGEQQGGGGKHQKRRAKKSSTHIDMTPMVDLAFLLLTFFVLTSTFSKPSAMEIAMPIDDPNVKPTDVKNIVTIVLDKSDTVYYYYGILDTASAAPYQTTNYSEKGIRKTLIDLNSKGYDAYHKVLDLEKKIMAEKGLDEKQKEEKFKKESSKIMSEKGALTVVVKTFDNAKYGRVIDIMDEMSIVQVGKYALVEMSDSEKALLQKQKQN